MHQCIGTTSNVYSFVDLSLHVETSFTAVLVETGHRNTKGRVSVARYR